MKLQYSILPFILPGIFLFSCTGHQPEKVSEIKSKTFPKNKPAATFTDTLKINSAAAVFYEPDSLQRIKIKASMDSGAFASNMHEYENLFNTSRSVIKKDYSDLQILEARDIKYLLFVTTSKKQYLINLDKVYDPCGLYAFDGKQPPQVIDMSNVETGMHFYFQNK